MDSFKRSGFPVFVLYWADVAKIRVATSAIIKHFDIFENIGAGFFSCAVLLSVDAFAFQDTKKAFDNGIVITVSIPAHRAFDVMLSQDISKVITGILCSSIRMVD